MPKILFVFVFLALFLLNALPIESYFNITNILMSAKQSEIMNFQIEKNVSNNR